MKNASPVPLSFRVPRRSRPMVRLLPVHFALLAGAAAAPAQTTLREAAARVNLKIGVATSGPAVSSGGSEATALIRREFNILVAENDMKFQSTEPSRGRLSFSRGDQLLTFTQANNMKMRGHTLIWHAQSGWASTLNAGRVEMLQVMKDHINGVLGHYQGKILEWDVVNEAIADGTGTLRNTFWRSRIGDDYIDSAFVFAHRADPAALLYYNDYSAESMNTKSNGVYELVKGMKERGIPIHGVGFQCHFGSSFNRIDVDRNMKRIAALGLRISITELDIVDASHSTRPWTELMDICMGNPNCTSFLTWGLYDARSWKAQNGTCNCLIYDTQMRPKAIHGALLASMAKADPAIAVARKTFGTESTARRPILKARSGKYTYLQSAGERAPARMLFSWAGQGRLDALGRFLPGPPPTLAEPLKVDRVEP